MKGTTGSVRLRPAGVSVIAIGAMLWAWPSQAQGQAQPQAATKTTPAPPPEADTPGLQDIIVTAQRRAENLQDVPIAVTAVTADSLKQSGISATKDLPQLIPSVQMTRSGPSGLFFIRGVGTTNAAAGEEGANAIYVDGVYLGDLGQTINSFNNIERVEVLKGPQGTLFGRNATGGLIQIITREPGQDYVLDGQFGYANYQTVSSQAYIAGPITNTLSADIAWSGSHQNEGWGRNLTRQTDNAINDYEGVRSKIVWRPNADLKFTVAGDYFTSDDNLGLGWRLADGTVGNGGTLPPTGNNGHDTTANALSRTRLKIWGVSFTAEADLGFASLTNIAAMRRNENRSEFDVDGGPIDLVNINYLSLARTYQEEIRLASKSTNPFSWQVGFFYLRSEAATAPQDQTGLAFAALSPAIGLRIDSSLNTDSYAGFGEATYAITPTTKITGGLRYTADSRAFQGTTYLLLPGKVTGPALAASSNPGAVLNYNAWTYRGAIRQEITDDISVYVSVNRGFKAGAFSLQSPGNAPVLPQYIMAYEGGIKSELFDRKLRLNLAGYHYDISNYQVRSAAAANPGSNILLNAATVKVNGFDAEFEAAPTRALHLFGGLTVLDSTFSKFGGVGAAFQAPISYPNPATCPAALRGSTDPGVLGAGPRTGGVATCFGDVSGLQTPLAPKFTGSIGASLTIPTSTTGEVRVTGLYSYNSGYVFEPDNVAKQGAFSLVNASIEYRPVKQVGLELFAKNLTNERYSVQDLTTGTGITESDAAPRTYGFNIKFDF